MSKRKWNLDIDWKKWETKPKGTVVDVLNVPESDIPEEQKKNAVLEELKKISELSKSGNFASPRIYPKSVENVATFEGAPVFSIPETEKTTAILNKKPQTLTPEESTKLVGGIQGAERGGAPLTSEKEIENANKLALMVDTLEVGVDMLSPVSTGRAVLEGAKATIQKAKDSYRALEQGEVIEALTGFAVTGAQGVLTALSLTPQMAGFNYAANIAGTIAPEATQMAMQPITSLTKPETETEKNLAELGDIGATLLVAFGTNVGRAVIGKYGKSIPKNILDSAKQRIESIPSLKAKFEEMITPEVTKATPEDLAGANIRKVSTKRGDRYVDLNTNKMVSKKEASDLLKQSRGAKNAIKEGEVEQSNIPQREEVSPRGISEEAGSRNIVEESGKIQEEIANIKSTEDALAIAERYKDNPEAIKILEQEKIKRDAEQQRAKEEYIKDASDANDDLLSQKNTEAQVIGEALQKIKTEVPKVESPTIGETILTEGVPAKTAKDINRILVEKGFEALPDAELAKFTPQTRASQAGKITDLITSNYDNAVKMMSKEIPIPDDINPRLLFNAVIEKATADANGVVLQELAKSPFNTETSLAGQTLSFTARNKPQHDPLTAINEVTSARSQSGIGKTVKYLEDRITNLEEQLAKKDIDPIVRKTQFELRKAKRERTKTELIKEWDDINKELFIVLSKPHAGIPVDAIPLVGKMMVNLVERGVTKTADIVDTIYSELRHRIEGLDKKAIQDALSKYGIREETAGKVKELEKQLAGARLESDKARISKQIAEYNRRINEGDYSTPERQPRLTDPEKVTLQKKLSETRDRYNKVKRELGDLITTDEAQKIANLSNEVQVAKDKMDTSDRRKVGEGATPEELEFGLKQVDFEHYVNTLKSSKNKTTFEQFKARPVLATREALRNSVQISRSMVSALDNSFFGRQGLRVLYTQDIPDLLTALPRNLLGIGNKDIPRFIWSKTLAKSFEVMYRTFRKQDIARTIRAEMISDPIYGKLKDAGVALGTVEEAFPSDFKTIDRVPLLGRSYRATETAYTTSAHYMRYQVGKRILQIAEASGVDTNNKFELQSIGRLVNDLTARGKIGNKPDRDPGLVNAVIWSPKMLTSHVNTITSFLPYVRSGEYSSFAKIQSAKNILKIGASIGAIQMIANSIRPGSAEINPLSSDWGKIKIGNRTIDYTGGMGSFITLLSRIFKQEMIDKGGVRKELGLKTFGSQNTLDLIYGFLEGKTAPVASEVISHMKGETRDITPEGEREKPTILRSLLNLYIPLSARNAEELLQTDFGMEIAAYATLDALGFSVKDYRPTSKTGKFLKSLNETDREEMLKILNLESEVQALKAKGLEQKDKEMLREYLTKSAELNKAKRTPLYRQYLSKGQETKKKNEEILRSAR